MPVRKKDNEPWVGRMCGECGRAKPFKHPLHVNAQGGYICVECPESRWKHVRTHPACRKFVEKH